ncbi:MAG: hypothetical protein IJO73_03690 [Clostridia bacterium]|nr:hypothetical protein [Clostridia bacterium]
MATVIYQTNTGSSKEYAELLSEKLSLPVFPLSKSDAVSADEEIIFIGWVMAGDIQGLSQARQKFSNIICVCSVGLSGGEKSISEIKTKCSVTEPLFFLPGNFHLDRLTGMYKMMMSMMVKMLKSKLKEKPGADTDKLMTAIETGVDQVSEEKLDEVIAFLSE